MLTFDSDSRRIAANCGNSPRTCKISQALKRRCNGGAFGGPKKKPAENRPELEKPDPAGGQQRGESIRQTGGSLCRVSGYGVTNRYIVERPDSSGEGDSPHLAKRNALKNFFWACASFGLASTAGRKGASQYLWRAEGHGQGKGGGSRWEGKLEEKGMG